MTFLWHDYETFGINPALDRPVQFAAIRTDEALKPLGSPMTWFARPGNDTLPHPMACLVTGITPQHAQREGVSESEFAQLIQDQMMQPGTCSAGYNSLNFDDEVSRHLFYRNFLDVYGREFKNGNSRWDLIDLVRVCFALRPEGIEWPVNDEGNPSFRLEHLTAANGIEHAGAHDALVDVQATIALAALIRERQPRLFEWALRMRDQTLVGSLLNPVEPAPVVFTSGRIPATRGCTTLVLPMAQVPDRKKSIIVFDLMADPGPLLDLSADEIAERVFVRNADLPEGVERIPLQVAAINKVPMLSPLGTLKHADTGRIGLDIERCQKHAHQLISQIESLRSKLMDVYLRPPPEPQPDPDLQLYSGGFASHSDQSLINKVRRSNSDDLSSGAWPFQDERFTEMLFRYRARNHLDSLTKDERQRWDKQRLERLNHPPSPQHFGFDAFAQALKEAENGYKDDPKAIKLLAELGQWVHLIAQDH